MRLRIQTSGKAEKGRLSAWIQAFRLHFVPPSFIPVTLAAAIAWARYSVFDPVAFVLVFAGVTVHHVGLNMLDDVLDYLHAVDRAWGDERNPYSGGSGVLTEGLLSVSQMRKGVIVCYTFTIGIWLYLGYDRGWPVAAIGAIGILSSIFYTAPPVKFAYRGFGELGLLVNFGPVLVLGSYYVQRGTLDTEPLVVSLVPGFLMWSMIVINEIPDYEEDRRSGKLNLVARFGREAGVVLYEAGLLCAFGIIAGSVFFGVAPFPALLGFAALPPALRSVRLLRNFYQDRLKMIPANLAIIKVYLISGVALIAGYLLHGFTG
ncbi:MAG: 1,4-dihydroxy-2-naphthoate octaprenyltransferase [Syntrophus sp. PtaU1.Bin208]|nr:MAG: 1,4-dihydroxy-2-naphthoate octaprenyltransferase [Syntrophus sp. PtaU1.Bin208]